MHQLQMVSFKPLLLAGCPSSSHFLVGVGQIIATTERHVSLKDEVFLKRKVAARRRHSFPVEVDTLMLKMQRQQLCINLRMYQMSYIGYSQQDKLLRGRSKLSHDSAGKVVAKKLII